MRCPICGCKMPQKTMCIYCKITGEQVENASNIKAKQAIKNKQRAIVHYSSVMPKDVNRTKLIVLTVLLGFFGAGNYYVGKYLKGAFCTTSWILYVPFGVTHYVVNQKLPAIELISQIFALFVMVTLLLWVADMINLVIKSYKVPVVIPESKTKVGKGKKK